MGIGAKGIIKGREDDQFGFGWYYLDIADAFEDEINNIPVFSDLIGKDLEDETGLELYYNFAVTPAWQLTLSGQYIFNPFLSEKNEDTFVLGGRVNINF